MADVVHFSKQSPSQIPAPDGGRASPLGGEWVPCPPSRGRDREDPVTHSSVTGQSGPGGCVPPRVP